MQLVVDDATDRLIEASESPGLEKTPQPKKR
jgi:hypothetical protein